MGSAYVDDARTSYKFDRDRAVLNALLHQQKEIRVDYVFLVKTYIYIYDYLIYM